MCTARKTSLQQWIAFATVCFSLHAAAETYPTRPVTMIVPFPAGGGTDVTARLFAKELGGRLGQTIIVDNRPGAAGNLGTASAVRAPADGYTLLFTAQSPITIADSVSKTLAFNPTRDLIAVVKTQVSPALVVVSTALPVKSLTELATLSHASPSSLFFGSPGTGNELHLAGEWIKREANVDMTHVPYKGTAPALQDLIAGRIQLLVAAPASVKQYIADGRLRAIATLSTRRLAGFPSVPTAVEGGFPQLVYEGWFGLFSPKNTPMAVLTRLREEALSLASVASYNKQLSDLGMASSYEGSEAFNETIRKDRAVWSGLVRSLNLTEDIYK